VPSLFISHSSHDRSAAEGISERLRAQGFGALFLDFDPQQGIPAGRSWERELYAQLRRNDAVLFLASAASVNSRWCFAEVSLARSLAKLVVPLRLEEGARLPLLDDVQWVDLAEGEAAFTRLWEGLRRAGLDPADSFAYDPTRPPYRGLEAFGPEDAAVFFGREQEINRLLELLQPTLQRGAGRFVAIVGPSGSGKSSLLRAGLLPRLGRLEDRWVVLPPLLLGQRPLDSLARGLARAFADQASPRPLEGLRAQLDRGPAALVELAQELAEAGDGRRNVLLVVDQAEELLTRSGVQEQHAFLDLVDGALGDDSPLWVVATIRSEFLSSSPERAGLARAVDDVVMVEALGRSRLPEVIERPAQRAGLQFAPGLVERMAEETKQGDGVPLLAYTLRELYQRAGPDGTVSTDDYEAVGGVIGALQRRADRLVDELNRRGQGALVLPTLTKLVAVEGESEPTSRRLRRSALTSEEQAVVQAFVDARLLVSRGGADEEATVEVAHEALLRQWPPLREAIESSRASLRMRSELERLASDWDRGARDESYLLRGGRLASFDGWASGHAGEVTQLEDEFLGASRALASRELDMARRSNRRLRALVSGLAVLLVLTLAAGVLALQSRAQAQSQARLALSGQLSAQSDRLVQSQPDTAILLGLQSLSVARDDSPRRQPPAGLITGLARTNHASTLLDGHTDQVHAVAFSPDGKLLATASWDRTVQIWNVGTGRHQGPPLTSHQDAVNTAAFSPDGSLLATAGWDRVVRLHDVATGAQRGQLSGAEDAVNVVAFSPDGKLLAAGGRDGTVRLWRVDSRRPYGQPLTGHENEVTDLAFSPDGELLATTSFDGTVRLWRVDTGRPDGEPIVAHGDYEWVTGVAFSPDGKLLATAGADDKVRLWEVASRTQRGQPLSGHRGDLLTVAFSPDGKLLASTGIDRTVRLWDVASRSQRGQALLGHTNEVHDVAFSPDGKLLASAGWDGDARLWDVNETYSISRPLRGHDGIVSGVAFSPDGELLASAGEDGTVRLWRPDGRPYGELLEGHDDEVNRVAFSPDGELLASGSWDGTARLWEIPTGRPHGDPLAAHEDSVQDLAFSPDGAVLATASADTTVVLWDVATGAQRGKPLAHRELVNGVAFSPDGKQLATASSDQTVRVWNVATAAPVGKPFVGHTNEVLDVVFSRDGKLLASAALDRTVRRWEVATGKQHGAPLTGHDDGVNEVVLSPDGKLLATAGLDGSARLWELASGRPSGQPLTGHAGAVYGVAFSPDGKLLATAGQDGTARLWDLGFSSWTEDGCKLVRRNLSMSEWAQLVGRLPYQRTCPGFPSGTGAPADAPAARY
jgi:WD40 repeat protein